GIQLQNVWVAGDNYNDIAMLEMFHSCAMTNGVAEAKNKAEYVCDTVGDVIRIIREKSTV
ncbi:MAG: HAD hydrolase family protein, partial [Clostridia bacterium]|nr:HAD hydrolase family protein [Clostridia bacterium]